MISSQILFDALESRLMMSSGPINIAPPLYSYLGGGHSQVMVSSTDGGLVATLSNNREVIHTVAAESLLRAAWGKMPG